MSPPFDAAFLALIELFQRGPVSVLTGAGVSTESGIPDYRGPETRRRARNPIQYRDFVRSPDGRKRYWARSLVGFPRLARAEPNASHHALADLERAQRLTGIITQNVDGLHRAASSVSAIELHGALREVICMQCGVVSSRFELQRKLEAQNPEFLTYLAESAPDGDAELDDAVVSRLTVCDCELCGGPLKPHVVFFGENVPRPRVDAAMHIVEQSQALLVVGSSLAIFSGLRFVQAAVKRELPVAIVNLSETRSDPLAQVRIEARASSCLSALRDALLERRPE